MSILKVKSNIWMLKWLKPGLKNLTNYTFLQNFHTKMALLLAETYLTLTKGCWSIIHHLPSLFMQFNLIIFPYVSTTVENHLRLLTYYCSLQVWHSSLWPSYDGFMNIIGHFYKTLLHLRFVRLFLWQQIVHNSGKMITWWCRAIKYYTMQCGKVTKTWSNTSFHKQPVL